MIQYVVSGGGGAFMHATHQIPRIDLPGVSEDDFRCYPLRGDSLARYRQLYDQQAAPAAGASSRSRPTRRRRTWPSCSGCTPTRPERET